MLSNILNGLNYDRIDWVVRLEESWFGWARHKGVEIETRWMMIDQELEFQRLGNTLTTTTSDFTIHSPQQLDFNFNFCCADKHRCHEFFRKDVFQDLSKHYITLRDTWNLYCTCDRLNNLNTISVLCYYVWNQQFVETAMFTLIYYRGAMSLNFLVKCCWKSNH